MKNSRPAWKEFETLVARIERTLAPHGAVVKSPDHVPDRITGRLREVDASIRIPAGDSMRLIAVECRDHRKGRQDDRWIEQLVTKRDKIGASRLIAVSSSGFSNSAIATANHFGIELRQMSQITDREIAEQWVRIKISVLFLEFVIDRIVLLDTVGALVTLSEFGPDVEQALQSDPTSIPFLRTKRITRLISAGDLFCARCEKDAWTHVWSCHEGEFPLALIIESRADDWWIETSAGKRTLSRIELHYRIFKRTAPSAVRSAARYSSMKDTLMDVVKGTADLGDIALHNEFLGRLYKPFPSTTRKKPVKIHANPAQPTVAGDLDRIS